MRLIFKDRRSRSFQSVPPKNGKETHSGCLASGHVLAAIPWLGGITAKLCGETYKMKLGLLYSFNLKYIKRSQGNDQKDTREDIKGNQACFCLQRWKDLVFMYTVQHDVLGI